MEPLLSIQSNVDGTWLDNIQRWVILCFQIITARLIMFCTLFLMTGTLRWFDANKTRWRDLKGLVGLPKFPTPLGVCCSYVKLTGYGGGKMMVFWKRDFNIHLSYMETIYCAEIALERRNGDCWGKLEWYDSVLLVPMHTKFVKVLGVTLLMMNECPWTLFCYFFISHSNRQFLVKFCILFTGSGPYYSYVKVTKQ
ncbi:hypothetical protein Bca52824_020095 [Brassica carinata]|uniref:FKB95-like N-terminal Kelch domain-containing protein n=1 Tax=Brassica carinata TaxID=52824 RepID=A0A8X8B0A4_BRACI|nr:hypothetical protein Bca52824_020095 [Brassica carinata]